MTKPKEKEVDAVAELIKETVAEHVAALMKPAQLEKMLNNREEVKALEKQVADLKQQLDVLQLLMAQPKLTKKPSSNPFEDDEYKYYRQAVKPPYVDNQNFDLRKYTYMSEAELAKLQREGTPYRVEYNAPNNDFKVYTTLYNGV